LTVPDVRILRAHHKCTCDQLATPPRITSQSLGCIHRISRTATTRRRGWSRTSRPKGGRGKTICLRHRLEPLFPVALARILNSTAPSTLEHIRMPDYAQYMCSTVQCSVVQQQTMDLPKGLHKVQLSRSLSTSNNTSVCVASEPLCEDSVPADLTKPTIKTVASNMVFVCIPPRAARPLTTFQQALQRTTVFLSVLPKPIADSHETWRSHAGGRPAFCPGRLPTHMGLTWPHAGGCESHYTFPSTFSTPILLLTPDKESSLRWAPNCHPM
jgi:hypothetical protein